MKPNYYYLVFSQKDLLRKEVFEEILRERSTFYGSQKKQTDFWLLISPSFLKEKGIFSEFQKTVFYQKQIKQLQLSDSSFSFPFFAAILSTNKSFILWLKLRYGYDCEILGDSYDKDLSPSLISTALSQGVIGSFDSTIISSPLSSSVRYLDPEIGREKYTKILNSSIYTVDYKE